ncbi:uncharacterized protein LOC110007553 [Amborella trichopoda]|uniref:uncharacterized protein LOC110007553 n=1 Tax=Amborella trichopoda TaxID=13333 RepID=UPI0009C1109E|nr:uncharacterized protein LOC110007553 [Amborella trichopoda]|eukprot:XP_020524745.1 uncharacterized protein LOC110007553 [Amborella trichopoda]
MENDRCPVCSHCGKDSGTAVECYRERNMCLNSGKPSHWVNECPMIKIEDRPKTQGRVFALTKQEAKASISVIRGTLSICGVRAKALIDPCSSHSFVAPHFACHLTVTPTCLNYTLTVSTLVGDSLETDRVFRQCGINIDGCDLPVDLILLDIQDFDVILGMDWLYTYHATVNCHEKMVTFKCLDQVVLHFEGTRDISPLHLIFALLASHLLTKKCEGYLAYVVQNRDVQAQLEEIPVVSEYPEPDRLSTFEVDLSVPRFEKGTKIVTYSRPLLEVEMLGSWVSALEVDEKAPENNEEELQEAPKEWEEDGQATADELEEINLGDEVDPRPTFISKNMSPKEKEEFTTFL